MKILHTADWHLGKSIAGRSRLAEEKEVIDEIVNIANEKQVDMVLIAGDIFLSMYAPHVADGLLLDAVIRLSQNGKRPVIVIPGNHDDNQRLSAAKQLAEPLNIFLIENFIYKPEKTLKSNMLLKSGRGYLKIKGKDADVVVAFMPYPHKWFDEEKTLEDETLSNKVKRLFAEGASHFQKDTINIAMGHFFVPHGEVNSNYHSVINFDAIPQDADYVAMGHVHNTAPLKENAVPDAYYCGSAMQLYMDEELVKHVIVADLDVTGRCRKEFVQLKSPKKFIEIRAAGYDDCIEKMNKAGDNYVVLKINQKNIDGSEMEKIRKQFPNIVSFIVEPSKRKHANTDSYHRLTGATPETIFNAFCLNETGKDSSPELLAVFKEILEEEGKE